MTTNNGQHPLASKRLDQVFKALSHPIRRQIILAHPQEQPCDLATIISEAFDPDHPELLASNLHHVHLPFLDDAGILDWDQETNTITTGDQYDITQEILHRLEASEEAVL